MRNTQQPLPPDCTIRLHAGIDELPAADWDGLVRASHGGQLHPCLRHAFLLALEQSGSATADTGWGPCHLSLWQDGQLQAATPLYLKSHSYGEYVFDWAWAEAYERQGLAYFPKLLTAIPFTPVFGQRLLARTPETRSALFQALLQYVTKASTNTSPLGVSVSSWHGLFMSEADLSVVSDGVCLTRHGVQFHWQNHSPVTGNKYQDFDEFLSHLNQKKRKNIRAERRKVQEANVTLKVLRGNEADDDDWNFFYRCYVMTYAQRRSTPYLTPDFFARIRQTMADQVLLSVAYQKREAGEERVASSLCFMSDTTLYGRYWGAIADIPCLHFETAYYAPMTWAIEHGISTFEGGAQGEHKLARGFVPVKSSSLHWLAHSGFYDAVDRFLAREGLGVDAYLDELHERLPFRGD